MKLFVYGTLKRGYGNNRALRHATFLGEARLDGYCIYNLGAFPAIEPRNGCFVIGELYEVNEDILDVTDVIEGVDHRDPRSGMYRRELVTAEAFGSTVFNDHELVETYVYVYNNHYGYAREIIENGIWNRP